MMVEPVTYASHIWVCKTCGGESEGLTRGYGASLVIVPCGHAADLVAVPNPHTPKS